MSNEIIENLSQRISLLESQIEKIQIASESSNKFDAARVCFIDAIQTACQLDDATGKGISETIEKATNAASGRRESAILALRALSIDGLLPLETEHQLERRIISLVEAGFRDQLKSLKLDDKRQTYEKIASLRGLHDSICQQLRPLAEIGPTLADINAASVDILKALKNGALSAYLPPFGWTTIKAKISKICDQACNLHQCKDATYKLRFDELEEACNDLHIECDNRGSFLTKNYVKPFVVSIITALKSLKEGSAEKFSCILEPRRRPPEIAIKKYQLHIKDKWLTVNLPFVNHGPGVAVAVHVELDAGSKSNLALEEDVIHLGDVQPGEFSISFRALVLEPMINIQLALQLTWGELFGETKSTAIDVRLVGQDGNIDWPQLELLEPYSLEVADGDLFVGRRSKVQSIGNRLLRAKMSSTYITGQKRIGKTSLAQAVLRYIEEHASAPLKYRTLYLEWGEYSNADPAKSVESLGECLHSFLCSHLPSTVTRPEANFAGSLAPLNGISRLLEQHCINDRFVIVLDEFDEIHPEMYRHGALAEAFFANLRTLSSKNNLAFILVGGEKMPFIIGAQGDQLNKFVREPLDFFSRSSEWEDYVELVTAPVKNQLNWQESALSEIFNCTAGHPYYTKLICSKIFSTAVSERDTEILATEVRQALTQSLSELDTNSFAHFWKDGVDGERGEAEVIELKRLRVLVAFGRGLRSGAVTKEVIHENIGGLAIDQSSVGPIIDDFLRRDVFRDLGGKLTTSLPLFQRWICDVGVNKLISSTLADDIENELQKANELAYVKAAELASLVALWPLYRGHEITAESVRAWLDQVPNPQDQRLLFKLLRNLNFVTPTQISDLLRQAHEGSVSRLTPPVRRENKVERRRDLLVTYLDGAGKSGAGFARAYAKEIGVLLELVIEPSRVPRRLAQDDTLPNAIVIVDDFAGTGQTIATAVEKFLAITAERLQETKTPVVVVLLFSTEAADLKLRKLISQHPGLQINVHIGTILGDESRAFLTDKAGIWKDEDERDRAKALCIRLGTGLYKDALGFGSQGLLISFPDGCPNNSLPILFASGTSSKPWQALLPRAVS